MPGDNYKQHDDIYKAIAELTQVCRNLEARSVERDKKVDEMFKFFNNGAVIARALLFAIKWSFVVLTSIGGAYLMYRNIIQDRIF